jgi:cystathionine gamma-synthase/methionine-gamma-lyase
MEAADTALGDASAGYVYSRNAAPTQEAMETAVAALEGAAGAVAFASGMAALHAAVLAAGLAPPPAGAPTAGSRPGRLITSTELYGASVTLAQVLAEQAGLDLRWANARDLPAMAAALTGAPARSIVLFEVISNPLCRVADARALIALAQQAGVAAVVDSTFTTPYLIQPLALGADFVVHSATKYLGGHGDVLAGVVAARTPEGAAELQRLRTLLGSNLGPFDAYLTLRGLRTLALRVREQNANALGLAQWLAAHPRVARVYYPGLPDDPDHALAQRLLRPGCFGGVLAFDLAGAARAEVFAFLQRLRLVQRVPTLGDLTTLAAYPAIASHRALTPAQRGALGIGDGCVRISAGIEALDDLIADLAQALG